MTVAPDADLMYKPVQERGINYCTKRLAGVPKDLAEQAFRLIVAQKRRRFAVEYGPAAVFLQKTPFYFSKQRLSLDGTGKLLHHLSRQPRGAVCAPFRKTVVNVLARVAAVAYWRSLP